jgi:cell division protein FtsI (penicillin-binding protein 3)
MPDRKTTRWMKFRLLTVVSFVLLCVTALVYRIWTLQVTQADWLQGLAQDQYLKEIALEPMRGAIADRHGAPIAVSVSTDSIFATPDMLQEPDKMARQLADILELDPGRLIKRLKSKKHFIWIKRRVTPDEADRIRRLDLPGIHFTKESRRFYPGRELAGSIVGFAGDGRGLEGIELVFDGQLRGATVLAQGLRDARGNLLFADGIGLHEASQGGGVVLSIDRTIQEIVETELTRVLEKSGALSATAIVMDPATGEILAMANVPTFNPNTFWKYNASRFRNRAVTDCYEPGSTMKVFVMASALQAGLIKTGDSIDCQHGRFEVAGHTIHDSHRRGFGNLSPKEILVHSSNIGMAKIGMLLGRNRLWQSLQRFGFGSRTKVDLPGESRCLLHPSKKWSDVDLASISFGQGVSVTPLQMVTALSAVANGGVWMRPLIVREIRGSQEKLVQRFEPEPAGRVLDSRWAKELTRMMVGVTEKGGTGERAAIPGFKVAGKTGTAEKADLIAGGYSKDKRIASFMGFVPAESPRIAILVVVDEPVSSPYGGVVAAPAFSHIGEATLRYLKVFPRIDISFSTSTESASEPAPADPPEASSIPESLPDVRGLSVREALCRLSNQDLEVTVTGSGRVIRQTTVPGGVALTLQNRIELLDLGTELALVSNQGARP